MRHGRRCARTAREPLAQLVEHRPFKPRVVGSIPTRLTLEGAILARQILGVLRSGKRARRLRQQTERDFSVRCGRRRREDRRPYNQRFGRPAKNAHNAHRPLRSDEDLSRIFTWQEERTMSRNLVVSACSSTTTSGIASWDSSTSSCRAGSRSRGRSTSTVTSGWRASSTDEESSTSSSTTLS